MKLINARLIFVLMALFAVVPAHAMNDSASQGWKEPIISDDFEFTAELVDGKVKMHWDDHAPEGFAYYKIVRSTTKDNPMYPEDSYIAYYENRDHVEHVDSDVPHGNVYYRVCTINDPYRHCSKVVKIVNEGGQDQNTDDSPVQIQLGGKMTESGIALEWTLEGGDAPKGFKVTRSREANPIFPKDGIHYLDGPGTRSFLDKGVVANETYHYRVCRYTGDGCDSYSNNFDMRVSSAFMSEKDDHKKEEEKKEEHKDDKSHDESELEALKREVSKLKGELKELRAAFKDVEKHAYKQAIDYLRENRVVQGYEDGSFKPDNSINRAEFMKIVMEAKYSSEISDDLGNCFEDVKDEWFTAYVCLAKQKGIVKGYADGKFQPGQNISFVEAAKILSEVYGLDITEGKEWYEGYVKALQKDKYVPKTVNRLDKHITRAEMAELIWRIKEQKKDQESTNLINE